MTDDGLTLVSAAAVSLAEFAKAFTAGFEGYPHPVVLDTPLLARRARLDNYDLKNSLIAYEGGEAVGVAVLAARAVAGGLRVLNEPEESLFVAPLIENGFAETERQHEMVIEFS